MTFPELKVVYGMPCPLQAYWAETAWSHGNVVLIACCCQVWQLMLGAGMQAEVRFAQLLSSADSADHDRQELRHFQQLYHNLAYVALEAGNQMQVCTTNDERRSSSTALTLRILLVEAAVKGVVPFVNTYQISGILPALSCDLDCCSMTRLELHQGLTATANLTAAPLVALCSVLQSSNLKCV